MSRFDPSCLRLYLITDRSVLATGLDLCEAVSRAIDGGVTIVQLREKELPLPELERLARRLHQITSSRSVPLIINDRVDVMLEIDAEGVHLGQSDMAVCEARNLVGDKIVGATAKSRAQILQAFKQGADYVGLGPVFRSTTKPTAGRVLGPGGLSALAADSPLPCVAIGGIEPGNAHLLADRPVAGVCAIRGILGQPDITEAARRIRLNLEGHRQRPSA